jgi:hypothetical protein
MAAEEMIGDTRMAADVAARIAAERTRRIRWGMLRGRAWLVLDFARLDPAVAVPVIDSARIPGGARPPESVLTLTDVDGSHFNAAILRALRELMAHNAPLVKAAAVIGLSPRQRIAYDLMVRATRRRNVRTFTTRADAEAWLSEQA